MNTYAIIAFIVLFLCILYKVYTDMQKNNTKSIIISTIELIAIAVLAWNIL